MEEALPHSLSSPLPRIRVELHLFAVSMMTWLLWRPPSTHTGRLVHRHCLLDGDQQPFAQLKVRLIDCLESEVNTNSDAVAS